MSELPTHGSGIRDIEATSLGHWGFPDSAFGERVIRVHGFAGSHSLVVAGQENSTSVDRELLSTPYVADSPNTVARPDYAQELNDRIDATKREWEAVATRLFARMQALEVSHERNARGVSQWFANRLIDMMSWGEDWDGRGALPIQVPVARKALDLAGATSDVVGEPEPIPAADGSIQLLWTAARDAYASLFIEADGTLSPLTLYVGGPPQLVSTADTEDVRRALRELMRRS